VGGKGKQFDYPHEIGKQVESSKIQQASTLRCASLDGMKGLSLLERRDVVVRFVQPPKDLCLF